MSKAGPLLWSKSGPPTQNHEELLLFTRSLSPPTYCVSFNSD